MTLDEAQEIVRLWGHHLEFHSDKLHALFMASIPKSLLPVPREKIEEALNIVAKRHHDRGDVESYKLVHAAFGQLLYYEDDEKALQNAAWTFGTVQLREVIISNLKKIQDAASRRGDKH